MIQFGLMCLGAQPGCIAGISRYAPVCRSPRRSERRAQCRLSDVRCVAYPTQQHYGRARPLSYVTTAPKPSLSQAFVLCQTVVGRRKVRSIDTHETDSPLWRVPAFAGISLYRVRVGLVRRTRRSLGRPPS